MQHHLFTAVLSVRPGEGRQLYDTLDGWAQNRGASNRALGLDVMPGLHYASIFMFDDPEDGEYLVFEFNADTPPEEALTHFIRGADRDRVIGLLSACDGFMHDHPDYQVQYLLDHVHHPLAGHVGNVGRTAERIKAEAALYRDARTFADSLPANIGKEAAARQIADHVQEPHSELLGKGSEWHKEPIEARDLIMGVLWALVFGAMAIATLPAELWARVHNRRPDPEKLRDIESVEDHLPTNHMVSVAFVRPGFLHLLGLRGAFGTLGLLAKLFNQDGRLGGISTIHYAHWSLVAGGRRLMFVSNFDGSWDSYLDDFILKAAKGLTLAWSMTVGFPRSLFRFLGGAANGPPFKDFARRSMSKTMVWYSAYPFMSVQNVDRHSRFRQGLQAYLKNGGDTGWLAKL